MYGAELRLEAPREVRVRAGVTSYIPVRFIIPEGAYIYGNPKGPGIGRSTEIDIKTDLGEAYQGLHITRPEQYYPGNAPDWVWRHRDGAEFFIQVAPKRAGQHSILADVSALMCTSDGSCIPVRVHAPFTLFAGDAGTVTERLPAGVVPFAATPSERIITETVAIPYEFAPQFLNADTATSLAAAVLFGLIAGFLLNLMPCVLPVIGIKLLGITSAAGGNRRGIAQSSLAFTAGIVVSFAALAGLAVLGSAWGSPFQNAWFLRVMLLIVFAMALSMFGVFTLNVPALRSPTGGTRATSFLQGLLATLLATPCSGPFLGGTLAWTLTQGPAGIMAVFMSMAAGMSIPYLAVAVFPGIVKRIPRGGAWSEYLERGVGFLLAGTAIYLAGIVPDTAGGTMGALWMLLAAALGLWIFGRFGSPIAPARSRIIARVIAGALLITAILLPTAFVTRQAHLNASDFSFSALVENSRAGKLTFVYFTADWCPNCFAVEKLTLSSDRVAATLERHQAAIMKADITEPGTEAQALLEKLGSRSIPFAAVFPAGAQFSSPVALRDIYTPDELISAIEQAAARSEQGSEPVTEGFIQFNEK